MKTLSRSDTLCVYCVLTKERRSGQDNEPSGVAGDIHRPAADACGVDALMAVSKRNGRLSIRYRDAAGKHVRESLGNVTVAQARRIEAMRLAEVKQGFVSLKPISFQALSEKWFETTAVERAWAQRSISAYARSLKRLKSLNHRKVGTLRRSDLEALSDRLMETYSAKTVNFDLTVVHQVLDYGVRREYLHNNISDRQSRPRIKKITWRILKPEEIQLVDECFDNHQARLIFRTLVRTGIRRSEIRFLRVQDVDFLRGALKVMESKTQEGERWIALSARLVAELMEHCIDKHPGEYVFQSRIGGPLNPETYTTSFHRALLKAGITDYVRPFHDMRHTSLTNEAATAQSNPMALMARAGHRSMSTTRQYMHLAGVLFPDQAKALEALYGGKT